MVLLGKIKTFFPFSPAEIQEFPFRKYFFENIGNTAKIYNCQKISVLTSTANFFKKSEFYSRTTITPIVVRL